jgi:hypothetical protein
VKVDAQDLVSKRAVLDQLPAEVVHSDMVHQERMDAVGVTSFDQLVKMVSDLGTVAAVENGTEAALKDAENCVAAMLGEWDAKVSHLQPHLRQSHNKMSWMAW